MLSLDDGSIANEIERLEFDYRKSFWELINNFQVYKKISKEVSDVKMPPPVKDINYFKLESRIELTEFEYPAILKDSAILENDSLMEVYERGEDGQFLDKKLYKSGSWAYQHKPYNYYVAFLKAYFPEQYGRLEKKYLPENL